MILKKWINSRVGKTNELLTIKHLKSYICVSTVKSFCLQFNCNVLSFLPFFLFLVTLLIFVFFPSSLLFRTSQIHTHIRWNEWMPTDPVSVEEVCMYVYMVCTSVNTSILCIIFVALILRRPLFHVTYIRPTYIGNNIHIILTACNRFVYYFYYLIYFNFYLTVILIFHLNEFMLLFEKSLITPKLNIYTLNW